MISLQPELHTIHEDVTIWRVQDMMIYDDMAIWRFDDMTIWRFEDMKIWRYDDKYDFGLSWYYEVLIVIVSMCQAAKVDLVLTCIIWVSSHCGAINLLIYFYLFIYLSPRSWSWMPAWQSVAGTDETSECVLLDQISPLASICTGTDAPVLQLPPGDTVHTMHPLLLRPILWLQVRCTAC